MAYKKCLIATTKNLFDISKVTTLKRWKNLSWTNLLNYQYGLVDNGYWVSQTAYSYGAAYPNVGFNLSAGTYTYSAIIDNPYKYTTLQIIDILSNKTIYSNNIQPVTNNKITQTFTINSDSEIYISVVATGNKDNLRVKCTVTNIQLEVGNSATSYVPYGYLPSYKKIIKVNNNPVQLLDKSKYRSTNTLYGVTFTNNGDGSFTVNGTATARAAFLLIVDGVDLSEGDKICFNDPLDVEA